MCCRVVKKAINYSTAFIATAITAKYPKTNDLSNDSAHVQVTPVVLLDDITAELDGRAIDILLSTLAQLPCQVFMTSLTDDILPLVHEYWSEPNMFHVKQGQTFSP